jgi:DNA-binding response OmpR family regulator
VVGLAQRTDEPAPRAAFAKMDTPPSLLLIEDDRELVQMLTEYLGSEGFVVAPCGDGQEALKRLGAESFDLVILDVMLPGLNGFDLLRRLRQTLSMPVIMLTARGADVDRIVGLELGADDYLAKPFSPRELVARIRAVLRRAGAREVEPDESVVQLGSLRLDPAGYEAALNGQPVRLTGTEFRLLKMLIAAPGKIQTRAALSETVLARRLQPFDRSIDTHVSNLRRKLGTGPGVPEIRNIRGEGYVLLPGSEEERCEPSS